uniref:WD domain-containing protein, G-beta repeat-containing protein n=1 Tax=Candidatus Kentrum sp. LFY TaxID=2126342 RepID=A0A450UBB9_9GAMM|nr:MAG: WD domain-containing protein, G-beta repeat-containing protein [Candidatus Kentron sp. LFY]
MNSKTRIILLCLLSGVALFPSFAPAADRGLQIVRTSAGEELLRYGKSHALLVGVSDYRWGSGWKDLDSIPGELDRVAEALSAVGFKEIIRVMDPDDDELRAAFENFKDEYGFDENNRLLFFFAGHGHTDQDGTGYLVPRDAPDPRRNRKGFLKKALAMSQILAWARQIKARHALFLFDSCFSGSVFRERSLPKEPPHITRLTARRVRQFITAGSADEPVPARSTFAPAFSDALAHGKGDLDGDGYVTGMELGLHLEAEVAKYTQQTPQFGKIDEYELSQGDFVFVLPKEPEPPKPKASQPKSDPEIRMADAARDSPVDRAMELEFWNGIKESQDPALYRAYVDKFPNGTFAVIAKNRIEVGWAKAPEAAVPITQHDPPITGSKMGTAPDGAFAHPTPLSKTARLIVRSNVFGDTVTIDGNPVGVSGPDIHTLAPGEHTIRVEKPGFETFETRVRIAAGGKAIVRARLLSTAPDYANWRVLWRIEAHLGGIEAHLGGNEVAICLDDCIRFSPDGRRLLSGSWDNALKLWDVASGEIIRTFPRNGADQHSSDVNSVAFSPDGRTVLSGSSDHTLKLWDVASSEEMRTLRGHSALVSSAAFSPNGRTVLSGSFDNTLKLWDVASGGEIRTFPKNGTNQHSAEVNSVAFSPDGRMVLSGSGDHILKLWDTGSGRAVRTFRGHSAWVSSVAFSPDGRRILSGSRDNTLKLWDVASGEEMRIFRGHSAEVNSVAFSPDGRMVLSGSRDNTLKLWNVASGEEIRTFREHSDEVKSVAFSPDGRRAASGDRDGVIILWGVE